MSGLFTTLSSVAHALDAQRYGLEVTGQNIANLNTEGYTRRRLNLGERPASNGLGGVEVLGVRSTRDAFVQMRFRNELPSSARDEARSSALSVVESSLGPGGSAVAEALSGLFGAFSALSVDPQSSTARDGLLLQAKRLGSAFKDIGGRLDASRRQADADLRGSVVEVNKLSAQIAELNQRIGDAGGANTSALEDQLDLALEQLSKLTRISVITQAEGTVDVSTGAGRALVVGTTHFDLTITNAPVTGVAQVRSAGVDVTSELTDGGIGGLLQVRDTDVPNYLGQLDQLAYDLTEQVNTIHASGYDLHGAPGGAFFKPLVAVAGAAAQFGVDAGVAADASTIAASGTGVAGDNTTAKAVADLRGAKVARGGTATFVEAWSVLLHTVGSDSKAAQDGVTSRGEVLDAIERLRDSVSAVSLDEEAGHLLQFQRAYEANARFFTAVDATLSALLATFGAPR